jgi:proline iminopeptidase
MLFIAPMPPRRNPYMQQFAANLYVWMDTETRSRVIAAERARTGAADPVAACRVYWALFVRAYFAEPLGNARIEGDFCAGAPENLGNLVASRTLGSLGDWDWREGAANIDVPVLIIHGAGDPVPLEGAREWAMSIPNARLVVLERAGHVPYAEQPEEFFAAAVEFLNGSWPPMAIDESGR